MARHGFRQVFPAPNLLSPATTGSHFRQVIPMHLSDVPVALDPVLLHVSGPDGGCPDRCFDGRLLHVRQDASEKAEWVPGAGTRALQRPLTRMHSAQAFLPSILQKRRR
jgi:hypothetical protein